MLEKIISGGQSGADLGGLKFAKQAGFETGGHMPPGFLTEFGEKPDYATLYGVVEHRSKGYPPRTFANVKDSDGTIRFASNWGSLGERCTKKAIDQYKRPYIDVNLNSPIDPKEVADWLRLNNIQVLNVAGNRETTSPGIEKYVIDYLTRVFDEYKRQTDITGSEVT